MNHSPNNDVSGSRAWRWLSRLFYGLLWVLTLSLLSIAALRVVDHDGTHLLIWLNAFTRYIYLPAYATLAWAAWKRRTWLAIANIAIVCLHVAWIAPDFLPDRRFRRTENEVAPDAGAGRFRILFANVNAVNPNHESFAREIEEAHPDIAVLAEFYGPWLVAFAKTPLFTMYPYGKELRRAELGWINVYSRIPLESTRQVFVANRVVQAVDVRLGTQTLRIIGLHAPRPMTIREFDYEGFWNQIVPLLLAEKGPVVIVGDFNATQYSRVYKQLTAFRFRSAHEDRGRGYATTWPNGYYWLPPIRIDQALLSPEVECLSISEGEGRGSDHKPLILDVRVHPAAN
jgi:endonuclease/exonuclease/phosphatase (EEP) superfamily protein YafD